MQRLVDSVDELVAAGSARGAFIAWFEQLAAYIRVKHGLGEALHNAATQTAIDETCAPVTAAVGRLLDACVAEGRRVIELVFRGIGGHTTVVTKPVLRS